MPAVVRLGGLSKDVAICLIEEEDHTTLRVHTERSKLTESGQGRIWCQFRLMPRRRLCIVEVGERRVCGRDCAIGIVVSAWKTRELRDLYIRGWIGS